MQFPELSASPCTRRGRVSLISSSLSATMSSLALGRERSRSQARWTERSAARAPLNSG